MTEEKREKWCLSFLLLVSSVLLTLAVAGLFWLFVRGDFFKLCQIMFLFFFAPGVVAAIFTALGMEDESVFGYAWGGTTVALS